MDPDPPSSTSRPSTPRKVKFAPKRPPRRAPQAAPTKIAEDDGDDYQSQQCLARKVNEHLTRRGRKVEKKSSVQVAFSHGVASTGIRTFGKQIERTDDGSDAAHSKVSPIDEMQDLVTSISIAGTDEVGESSGDLTNAIKKKKREYEEPWDYRHSYYPISLPLRRPYSGDPELLDKAEFEGVPEYDENSLSSAQDLGLLDQDGTPQLLFFTFPSKLPIGRPPTSPSASAGASARRREIDENLKAPEKSVINQKGKVKAGGVASTSGVSPGTKGKEIAGSHIAPASRHPSKKECTLEELPEGYMGKMLVYKSGAVKLKLGDILYDVSPGSECSFPQSVMAINTRNRDCCELGELKKRAVVTPDIDSLVDKGID